MAKVKVHELAKEVGKQSKDIVAFLQEKGVEVKAAQSSVDESSVALVKKAFGQSAKAETPKAETPKAEAPKAKAPKVEAPKADAPKTEAPKAEAPKAEAPKAESEEAPKKKKKIIIVSNQQNSKISNQRNPRPQGRNENQGGYNNQRYQNQRPGALVRPTIKPLTPPSPTPSVQMVPNAPQNQKQALPATKTIDKNVDKTMDNNQKTDALSAETTTNSRPTQNTSYNNRAEDNRGQGNVPQGDRPQGDRPGYQGNRPQGDRPGYQGNRPQGDRPGYQGNRPQGDRPGYQGNRPQGDRPAYQGNRPQGDRPGYQGNRPQGDRPGYQGNRPQVDRPGYQGNRPQVDRPAYQGNRPQGDRPAYQGNRPQGDRPGYQGNRPQGDRPGYQGNRPQGDRPAYQGNRPQGGQYQNRGDGNRPAYSNQGGQRPSYGGNQGGNRPFNNNNRDGGRGFGGQGDRFKNATPSKGFTTETPIKDIEKKREEDKRRFSQEKDKRSKKDYIRDDSPVVNKAGRFIKPEKKKEEIVEEVIKVIVLPEFLTIKELAEKMKMQPSVIVKKLFLEGKIVTVNNEVTYEEAENIAMEYDILCEKEIKVDVIEELLKEEDEEGGELVERPPVICVMGHVDHGKTSLLDAIRKTSVTVKEAGGITQHIGAYTVNVGGRKITFLDTPGHEAFTAMRMRGANATDIAILVVAADDGVMPQTVEAINHAKAAGIEIIVAVNKVDKPSANIDRVKQELAEHELVPEDWGGTTVFAPVSAKNGDGIQQLLDMILLTSEILELKSNPKRHARGLVIEGELDKGRGPVATVLVQKGTLNIGDFISAGSCHGKVRAMIDDKGKRVKEAGPSTPVEILGLSDVPSAGEVFIAHDNDKTAKNFADTYLSQNKEKMIADTKSRMSLDDLFSQIKEGNLKELNLIVKADVQGSVEAVKQSLLRLSNEEVVVKCIHGGVGAINESDVMLASASSAIIIGFNVRPDVTAKAISEREGVDIRLYKVIYQAIEDIEAAMKGMLDPVFEEKVIGHAEIRQIFKASAIGNIAGSYVLDGMFQRGCKVRITREGNQIYEGDLASLKRFKDDVKEVKTGFECGLVFDKFDQVQEFDIVEAYIMVEVPR